MKKIIILVLACIMSLTSIGCSSPSSANNNDKSLFNAGSSTLDDPTYKYKIKGRVIKSSTLNVTNYEGVCSAEVCINGTNICALTNAEGYYLLYAPWGTYQLTITHHQPQFKEKTIILDISKDINETLITELELGKK